MNNIPGSRTSPTVKPLANLSQRTLRSWSLTLGPLQVVILLGIVTGCMACAFYFGFFSGQKLGLENALDNNLANVVRLPVDGGNDEKTGGEEQVSDIYARLSESGSGEAPERKEQGGKKESDLPQLGSIETLEEAPLEQSDLPAIKEALNSKEPPPALKEGRDRNDIANLDEADPLPPQVKTLGGEPEKKGTKTLGSLVREDDSQEEAAANKKEENAGAAAKAPSASSETQRVANGGREHKESSGQVKEEEKTTAPQPAAKEKALKEKEPLRKAANGDGKDKELPKAGKTYITSSVPKGWFAQIAAPRSQPEAQGLAQRLAASGFPVVVENAQVRGEQYYRVLVGPEENREQADRLINQLKRERYLKTEPFLRLVK